MARTNNYTLYQELTELLNKCSAEQGGNTPDYVLAQFLLKCLDAFDAATGLRDVWYERGSDDER